MVRLSLRALRSVLQEKRGIAAIEFALVGSAMLTLLLAAYDIGDSINQAIRLNAAVRAGGVYALSFPTDTSGIQGAVNSALPSGWLSGTNAVTVSAPVTACVCSVSGVDTTMASCTSTCAGTIKRFMTVSASRTFSPLMLSALSGNSASYVVRFQ